MLPHQDDHDWREYRRLVMDHMSRTDGKLDAINGRLSRIESEIEGLKVKSGLWGAVAGIVTTVGAILAAVLAGII
jgi:hypothetical protein